MKPRRCSGEIVRIESDDTEVFAVEGGELSLEVGIGPWSVGA